MSRREESFSLREISEAIEVLPDPQSRTVVMEALNNILEQRKSTSEATGARIRDDAEPILAAYAEIESGNEFDDQFSKLHELCFHLLFDVERMVEKSEINLESLTDLDRKILRAAAMVDAYLWADEGSMLDEEALEVAEIDKDQLVQFFNNALKKIHGESRDPLLMAPFRDIRSLNNLRYKRKWGLDRVAMFKEVVDPSMQEIRQALGELE